MVSYLYKIAFSVGIIIFGFIVRYLLNRLVDRRIPVMRKLQRQSVRQVFNILLWGLVVIAIISVWSLNLSNLWVFLTTVVGIVAIGFFAVWSILSNIIAGILLIMTQTIKVGDSIAIVPDDVKGKVSRITLMFTILEDEKGYIVHIPNNMLFQRFIKKK
ncbi:MAG: mechanosensitive ion channel domain-containing protein [Candidatus Woesearchaeota archaeon]